MILLNDGEFIAGSTWVVGYKPTDEDSVKIKGGLWLNEVGIEDTKKETTMIDLSTAKVGDKFVDESERGQILILMMIGSNGHYVFKYENQGDLIVTDELGKCDDLTHCWVTTKYEPVILKDGELYQFTIGGLVNCLGTYIESRKSFMNCGGKVCGETEATNIVKLEKVNG